MGGLLAFFGFALSVFLVRRPDFLKA
jgi:MFS transporter, DHA1 family, L-arabinose/isopropyl-beta-D-thiogalactopyranoside export protein